MNRISDSVAGGEVLNIVINAHNGVLLSGANADVTTGDGSFTVNADIDANGTGTFTSGDAGSAVSATSGAVSITAADVALTGTLAGTSTIALTPSVASSTIGIGAGSTGTFQLLTSDLAQLTNGFSSITIGDATNGTGAVDINSSTFNDPITIVGGSIAVTELNAGLNDVTLTARTGAITDGGNDSTDIIGGKVNLVVMASGNEIGVAGPVGGPSDPLEIDVATLLNASTVDGHITLEDVGGNLPLGVLNAGAAMILLTTRDGAMTDGNDGIGAANLTAAAGVNLTTNGFLFGIILGTAIGTEVRPIRTVTGSLSATTSNGGIFVSDSNAPGLIIKNVLAKEGGFGPIVDASNHVSVNAGSPHAGTFDVSITAQGPIVLNSVMAPDAVTLNSTTGAILDSNQQLTDVLARTVNLIASGAIGQVTDAIEMTAESFSASTMDGGIFLAETLVGTAASVVAGGANNNVVVTSSASSLRLGTITAQGNVTVKNDAGSLVDSNGATLNVTGQMVDLIGKSGIGTSTDPIETTAFDLVATASDLAAPIFVTETDGLNYVVVKTNDGNVTINFTGGPLSFTASTDVLNASGVPVTFETTGGGIKLGDVDVGSSAASITAFGAIQDDSNNSTVVRGGTVTLKAGTGIGAVGNEIDTDVMTLTATTTSGVIQIREANALTLTATTSSGNIDVRNTTGDLTLLTVSTTGNVTLHADGAILDGNANSNNVSANMLDLAASTGVGASTDVLETSVSSLTAPSGLGGGLFLSNSKALNLDSVTATGSVSVATTGNLTVGTITAEDQSVTLSATGELIDSNGPTLNITAASATLNGSKIGTSSDKFETSVATLTAATSSGGLFVSDFGTTSLTLTATAIGQGADIDIDGAGDIVLETATAQGDTVKLNAAGKILDGNDTPTTKPVNITANTLDIAAPGGIGTPTNQLEVNVNQVLGADGGAGGGSVANSGPLAIKEEALEKSGSGELVFDAESITILNIADNTATVAYGRSVVFRTQMGNIVFLDPADTIQTSGAGGITVQAGLVSGSGAVAVLGNLKTSGGAIIVSADRNITIGLLDAGTGSVSVISKAGVIVDGNGPSLNIIGGAATVSGVTPTARQAELNEINKIADAAGTRAEAAAKQTSFEAFNAGSVITDAAQTSSASAVARAADDVAVKTEIASAKEDTANSKQLAADIAAGVSQGLVIAADVVLVVASVAQAIPLTGDGGAFSVAAGLQVAADVAGAVAFGLQIAADIAAGEATDAAIAEAKAEAQLFAARSTLELATSTANAFKESTSIAKAAAEKAAIARDAAARVSDQATLARDQANALGTAAEPLGIQATGPVTITAGQSDIFLQLVGPTTLGNVTATGAEKTIEVSATGNITIQGTISSPTQVRIDTSSGAIVNGGGKISAVEFVATATAGVGTSGPLATEVDKIAISGGTGGVNISNTGNLEVTTIDGVVGVAATGAGIAIHAMGSITVTQPVTGTGACTVLLDATGGDVGDLFVNNMVSTVNGTLGLKATDDIVSNASGTLATTSGAVALTADSDNTDGGTITYTATVNHGSAGSTWSLSDTDGTMSVVISGTGQLTKTGTGTLTLSAANTYTGLTTINAGSLALSGGAAIANSVAVNLSVAGANLTLNDSETIGSLAGVAGTTVTLGDKTLTTGGNGNSTLYAGAIGGVGGKLTKLGTGTFTLSGTNSYTGLTTISGGTLALTGGSAIADTEPGSGAVSINVAGANMLLNDSETIGSLSGVTGSTVMLGNKLLTTGDASSTTFAGVISGSGGTLTKQGSGTFTLSGTNTYTGVTTVRAGTLALSGGSAILDTVAVNLSEAGADLTLNDSETIGSLTGVTDTTVTLGDQTLTTGFNDTSTSYAGAIGGTGGLTKVGTGTFTLTGVNTYTGLTTISGGTLALSGGAAIADTEPGSGAVSINVAGANLLLNDSETIGSLSGVDGTTVMLGDQLLTTGDASDTTFVGVISGDGGTLTKQGSGTFTLSGVNTYTGVTTVGSSPESVGETRREKDF